MTNPFAFIGGMTWGWTGVRGTWTGEQANRSMKLMADRLRINWTAITLGALQDHPQSTEINYEEEPTVTDDEVRSAIHRAKQLKLYVCLKPVVNCRNGTWRAHINFFDNDVPCEPKWSEWFASYTAFIVHYAKIAEETGCEMLCIGCEMVQTDRREREWRQLIKQVRQVYSGIVTYNCDKYQEGNIAWWDAVDVISSSGYYPIDRWEEQLDRIEKVVSSHNKPFFFMEAGCPSREGSQHIPNDWSLVGKPSEKVQHLYYETMFAHCDKRDWVRGFMLWDWPAQLYDEKDASVNDDYCMYGKQAERTIQRYYAAKINAEDVDKQWAAQIEHELKSNIINFWMKHAVDEQKGGFYGFISRDLKINEEADKSLVLNTRILWTFASAYHMYGNKDYLRLAERAYHYVDQHFVDHEYGGMYWMVDASGNPSDMKKQIYGQAFGIYALSEYYRATGHEASLEQAIELFHILERYSYDPVHKGYFEAMSRDWQETDNNSLSEKDLNAKKSMNTHLHIMEAYTNLYRVWKSDVLYGKLKELIEVTMKHIIHADHAHFILFFDEEWNSQSEHISYGHDIEGSWLLFEAAEVLGDQALLQKATSVAIAMAEVTYNEGVDEDGGLFNEAGPEGLLDTNKDWWPQAEAVVGFYNAYQMTGELKFREAAIRSWRFIENYIVDKEHGEWLWSVTRDGSPSNNIEKVSSWKCPYHNGRACFEMLERLKASEALK